MQLSPIYIGGVELIAIACGCQTLNPPLVLTVCVNSKLIVIKLVVSKQENARREKDKFIKIVIFIHELEARHIVLHNKFWDSQAIECKRKQTAQKQQQ